MVSENLKFNTEEDAINTLTAAYEAEDWNTCKMALIALCDLVPHELFVKLATPDHDTAMFWFKALMETGLDCSDEGTPPRKLFLELSRCVAAIM